MQTLQQRYAKAVYQRIQDVKQSYPDDKQKEYGALALKLPILVRQAGLVQALTFVAARQRDAHKRRILDDLAQVLRGFAQTGSRGSAFKVHVPHATGTLGLRMVQTLCAIRTQSRTWRRRIGS